MMETATDTVMNSEIIDEVLKAVINVNRQRGFYQESLEANKEGDLSPQHQSTLTPSKNQKLFDKVNVFECSEEQAAMNDLNRFVCYTKINNYRDLPLNSLEARQDQSQSQLQEGLTPSITTVKGRAAALASQSSNKSLSESASDVFQIDQLPK